MKAAYLRTGAVMLGVKDVPEPVFCNDTPVEEAAVFVAKTAEEFVELRALDAAPLVREVTGKPCAWSDDMP